MSAEAEHAFGKSDEIFRQVRRAALDRTPVSDLTHTFYRYPARFSPQFAGATIEALSRPGDLILDPYMGGATTIVEAIARGRRAVGCDLNSLAVFIARTKHFLQGSSEQSGGSVGSSGTRQPDGERRAASGSRLTALDSGEGANMRLDAQLRLWHD